MRTARFIFLAIVTVFWIGFGCGGGGSKKDPAPTPIISSFTATDLMVTKGDGTSLKAVFQNGVGSINIIGSVQSGISVNTGAINSKTVFILTVTNSDGVATTSSVTVSTTPWKKLSALISGQRDRASAGLLSDGRVCISGGFSEGGNYIYNSIELFDPISLVYSSGGTMSAATAYHKSIPTSDGKMLFVGGFRDVGFKTPVNSIQLYDPTTKTTQMLSQTLAQPRGFSACTKLANGKFLLSGGGSYIVGATASAELFDPSTLVSTSIPGMSSPRYNHNSVLLADGRVLIAGGWNGSSPVASCEIYNPATNTWSIGPTMPWSRTFPILVVLADGKLLIAGGAYSPGDQSTAALYDFSLNSWTTLPNMNTARSSTNISNGAISIDSNKILFTENPGGHENEYFDTSTKAFTLIDGPMWYQSQMPIVIKLLDGRILKAGGATAPYGETELFVGL